MICSAYYAKKRTKCKNTEGNVHMCTHPPPPPHTMGRKQRVPWGVSRCLCETVPYLLESAVLQFGGGMVVDLLAEVLVA